MKDICRKKDKIKLKPERIARKRNLEHLSLEMVIYHRNLYPQMMMINKHLIFVE